jgi:hypothetical protein
MTDRPASGGRRTGLGRGLGALIPQSTGGPGLLEIDVDRIVPNPWQPRLEMDAWPSSSNPSASTACCSH